MRTDTHMEVWAMERASEEGSSRSRRWERFCDTVETILRIDDLDGDDSETARANGTADGYSIDEAYDFFHEGKLASEYAGVVRARLLAWGRT